MGSFTPFANYAGAVAAFHTQMVVETISARQHEHVASLTRLAGLWEDVQDAARAFCGDNDHANRSMRGRVLDRGRVMDAGAPATQESGGIHASGRAAGASGESDAAKAIQVAGGRSHFRAEPGQQVAESSAHPARLTDSEEGKAIGSATPSSSSSPLTGSIPARLLEEASNLASNAIAGASSVSTEGFMLLAGLLREAAARIAELEGDAAALSPTEDEQLEEACGKYTPVAQELLRRMRQGPGEEAAALDASTDHEDWNWAIERVTSMCASALLDAQVYRQKLLKGFGYPNETFARAQDYRALNIVLEKLKREGSVPLVASPLKTAWRPTCSGCLQQMQRVEWRCGACGTYSESATHGPAGATTPEMGATESAQMLSSQAVPSIASPSTTTTDDKPA